MIRRNYQITQSDVDDKVDRAGMYNPSKVDLGAGTGGDQSILTFIEGDLVVSSLGDINGDAVYLATLPGIGLMVTVGDTVITPAGDTFTVVDGSTDFNAVRFVDNAVSLVGTQTGITARAINPITSDYQGDTVHAIADLRATPVNGVYPFVKVLRKATSSAALLSRLDALEQPKLLSMNTYTSAGVLATGLQTSTNTYTYDCKLQTIWASVSIVPTGSSIVINVVRNAVVLTPITIPAGQGQVMIDGLDIDITANDVIQVHIDQVGSTTPGENLTLNLINERV